MNMQTSEIQQLSINGYTDGIFQIDEDSEGAYVVEDISDNIAYGKVIHEIRFKKNSRAESKAEIVKIAKLDAWGDFPVIDLYLMKEKHFGIAINARGIIEYFEFNPEEPYWEKAVGQMGVFDDNMMYSRTQKYYLTSDKKI